MKKYLVLPVIMMIGISLAACGGKKEAGVEAASPEAVEAEDLDDEFDDEEDFGESGEFDEDEEYFDDSEPSGEDEGEALNAEDNGEENNEDTEDAAPADNAPEEPENQISFKEVMDSYDDLVDEFNTVNEFYNSDNVPVDRNAEALLNDISAELNTIAALNEEDVPTDKDKLAVLIRIGELNNSLGELGNAMFEMAEEQQAYYNDLLEYVNSNYDYMNSYFDAVWSYFSENGGSDPEIEALIAARDEIGELGDISSASADELNVINQKIDHVISILDALSGSR